MFLGERKSTLFGLLKVDAFRNHSDYLQQNSNAFYGRPFRVCVCVCVCVCEREKETRSHNRGLCANTYKVHHYVCHVTLFPSQA